MISKNDGVCTIIPPKELVVKNISEFKTELLETDFSDCNKVVFDMSEVSYVDASGFQVLVGLKKELEFRNTSLVIGRMSHEAKDIINLLGARVFFAINERSGE